MLGQAMPEVTGYDVVGDIHGYAGALVALLEKLGYRQHDGVYSHPTRTLVFLGDLIDRGTAQLETLRVARAMVDAGTAQIVMGNHEFNAICFATPDGHGGWCRDRSPKNRGQHKEFLKEVGEDTAEHRDWVEWFRSIPLWLELDGLRIVHACWDPRSMAVLGGPRLTDEMVAAPKGSPLYDAIEMILKGPEVDLLGSTFLDKDEHPRTSARVKWWDPTATTLLTASAIPGGSALTPPLEDVPLESRLTFEAQEVPVLYGHYWRTGTPTIDIGGMTACLDWSVANSGQLVAYRWSGERVLDPSNLVAVRADASRPTPSEVVDRARQRLSDDGSPDEPVDIKSYIDADRL